MNRQPGRQALQSLLMAAGLVLALVQPPAYGRHPDLELDDLDDQQIDALLQRELDDEDLRACGLGNPNAAVDDETMVEIILCALGDEGDSPDEQGLDFDDLEAEMEEANTSVEDVVRQAVQRADALASGPSWRAMQMTWVAPTDAGSERYAIKDGRVNPGRAAIPVVKVALRGAIRAVVR